MHTSNEWQFIFSHQMATVNCSQSRQLIILEVGHRQEWTLKGQGWHYGATGQVAIITHTKRITDAELIFHYLFGYSHWLEVMFGFKTQ